MYRIYLFFTFLLVGCSSKRSLLPLGENNSEIHAAVGGPVLIQSGLPIPAPYLAVGHVFGYSDTVNIESGIHVTPIFYKVLAFDVGYLLGLLEPTTNPLGLSFGNRFNFGTDFRKLALVTQFDLTGVYHFDENQINTVYFGPEYILSLNSTKTDNLFSAFLGYRFKLGDLNSLGLEFKWLAFNRKISDTGVNFWSPFWDQGRPGIYLYFSRKL